MLRLAVLGAHLVALCVWQGWSWLDCHKWWAMVVETDLKRREIPLCNIYKSI